MSRNIGEPVFDQGLLTMFFSHHRGIIVTVTLCFKKDMLYYVLWLRKSCDKITVYKQIVYDTRWLRNIYMITSYLSLEHRIPLESEQVIEVR